MVTVQSWGRLNSKKSNIIIIDNILNIDQQLQNKKGCTSFLAHGMGRSYGDSCLNSNLILTRRLNNFISFDSITGVLECEAGVLIKDINDLTIPLGWMLAVSPGTQFVTVGGAIANDVHGKNHHFFGSFGSTLLSISVQRTDGELIDCGPNFNHLWFEATIGGIGLTGVITKAKLQLRKIIGSVVEAEVIPFTSLKEFISISNDSVNDWEHTVAWVDCFSANYKFQNHYSVKGIFKRAKFDKTLVDKSPKSRQIVFPINPPFSLVNQMTSTIFNHLYFFKLANLKGSNFSHIQSFLYPLDDVKNWNQAYGKKGFYQYQCLIPFDTALDALYEILMQTSIEKMGSFLTVIKVFGNQSSIGMLGFPGPGITLAIDFPNLGVKTLKFLDKLDLIVKQSGGKLYLAKDARMSRTFFENMYPRFEEFLKFRDPGLSSFMSQRLLGC